MTPRQTEILRLIARGRTSRQIAADLGKSVATIDMHRRQLLLRLRVRNVVQLIRQALALRLLQLRDFRE